MTFVLLRRRDSFLSFLFFTFFSFPLFRPVFFSFPFISLLLYFLSFSFLSFLPFHFFLPCPLLFFSFTSSLFFPFVSFPISLFSFPFFFFPSLSFSISVLSFPPLPILFFTSVSSPSLFFPFLSYPLRSCLVLSSANECYSKRKYITENLKINKGFLLETGYT